MAVGSFVGAALVAKVGLWEKQSLVAVVRGLEMYEQADLARGRWVHHGSVGVFRRWTSLKKTTGATGTV